MSLEDYPKEKLQEIYEILPEDLKQALFSQEIAGIINDVGEEESLEEKQILKIVKYVGYVFLGLLPPNDFEKAIKKDLFLTEELARRINRQIIRLVFFPLKSSLNLIYKAELKLPPEINEDKLAIKEEPLEEEPPPDKRMGNDNYREPIE